MKVDKTKEDILIRCTKTGYQDAVATIPSDFQGWTLGNLLIGGVIGLGVDAATGAMNEYPHSFTVPMYPLGQHSSFHTLPNLPVPGSSPGMTS